MPLAATQLSQHTYALGISRKISQESGLGSPQAKPTMIVSRLPVTAWGRPSPVAAEAVRFVLNENIFKSPVSDKTFQPDQWCGFVTRQLAVESPHAQGYGG